MYSFIKLVVLGKEANEATGNQIISSTPETGNNYNLFFNYPRNIL